MHSRQQKKKTKQNETFFCMKEYCLQTKNIPGRPYNLKTRKKKRKEKIQETNLESSTLTKCPNISFRS